MGLPVILSEAKDDRQAQSKTILLIAIGLDTLAGHDYNKRAPQRKKHVGRAIRPHGNYFIYHGIITLIQSVEAGVVWMKGGREGTLVVAAFGEW
ncbi:MAG: hypothetical protein NVSMB27_31230 [Ktedonobacteraceae bacterium]